MSTPGGSVTPGDSAPPRLATVLVDDVAEMRDLLRSVLTRDGRFEIVGEAQDGAEAIRVVRQTQPDLVVLDIGMPTLDGIAALPEIREVSTATRVVMLSGYPSEQMARPALQRGAVGYIEKGEDVRTLPGHLYELASVLATVQRILDTAYLADLTAPRQARADLRAALASKVSPSTSEIVELLTTELITNAIQHGGGSVTVTAELSGQRVRVEVGDEGDGLPTPGQAMETDESGRGLAMVESLASRWGVEALSSGKIVWFEAAV